MAAYNKPMNNAPGPYMTTDYPPQQDAMYDTVTSVSSIETKVAADPRQLSRTPSPTPSEAKELKTGAIDWKTMSNPKYWIRREWLWYYVLLVVILVITALVTIYHKQIVNWLTPVTQWLFDLKFGWLVPIGVLFVISFPPLFGHEIVAILCGLVWGLWVGFAIVAAGTFLGGSRKLLRFQILLQIKRRKDGKNKITYACLARVVRDGGFKIALIARLSAIPGHFTTAVFSTCGMGIIVFSIAAILSLPKQFITVYLGVILKQSNSGTEDTKSKIISDTVLAVTFIITIVAMWYIYRQMNKVKPQVIYDRRKARQAKLLRAAGSPYMHAGPSMTNTDVFNPTGSDSDIPLTSTRHADPTYQQWDRHGNAVGYVPDPNLHTPQPRNPNAPFFSSNYPRDEEEAGGRRPMVHGREESTDVVGWDTPQRQARSPHLGGAVASSLHNPHSPNQRRVLDNEMTQTPTQANFVNEVPGPSVRAVQTSKPHGSFDLEDPYGGYEMSHHHDHTQEPTDTSYRTAYNSSPEDMDDGHIPPIPNPHTAARNLYPGPIYPSPPSQSPKPPSYATNLR